MGSAGIQGGEGAHPSFWTAPRHRSDRGGTAFRAARKRFRYEESANPRRPFKKWNTPVAQFARASSEVAGVRCGADLAAQWSVAEKFAGFPGISDGTIPELP